MENLTCYKILKLPYENNIKFNLNRFSLNFIPSVIQNGTINEPRINI